MKKYYKQIDGYIPTFDGQSYIEEDDGKYYIITSKPTTVYDTGELTSKLYVEDPTYMISAIKDGTLIEFNSPSDDLIAKINARVDEFVPLNIKEFNEKFDEFLHDYGLPEYRFDSSIEGNTTYIRLFFKLHISDMERIVDFIITKIPQTVN